jgi:hypothetical protein
VAFGRDWLRNGFPVELKDMNEDPQREMEAEGEEDAEKDGAGEEIPECLV